MDILLSYFLAGLKGPVADALAKFKKDAKLVWADIVSGLTANARALR